MVDTEYIQITHRELPYSTFDADNHMYENRDALTKFLPPEYEGVIKYVDIDGRTKLAIRDRISDYIPNPTFGKVAAPGGVRAWTSPKGGGGFGTAAGGAGLHQRKLVVMPGIDAFFDPEPRLAAHEGDGHRPHAVVADARERARGARGRRSRRGGGGDPRAERVDARALDLRLFRRALLHADHQPRGRRRSRASRSSSTSTSAAPRSS